jgi:hypothetical protein
VAAVRAPLGAYGSAKRFYISLNGNKSLLFVSDRSDVEYTGATALFVDKELKNLVDSIK